MTLTLPLILVAGMWVPHLEDLKRFPSFEQAVEIDAFSEAYRVNLKMQANGTPLWLIGKVWPELCEAWQQSKEMSEPWIKLRMAASPHYDDDEQKLKYLRELRELIGPAAYEVGAMPPFVPWWRFKRID